jgi:DNA-binding CsgD family transcriptional regulator
MGERTRGRPPHPDVLTPAEWNVLRHLREGLTNAEIAVRLGISPDGVKYHVSNMLSKSGAKDREELAQWKPPPAQRESRMRVLLAAAGAAVGVATLLGVGVVAVAFFDADNGDDRALPDLAATRHVESFVIERTTMILPEHYGIPSIPGEVRNVERVHAKVPDRERTEETNDQGVYVTVRIGTQVTSWDDRLQLAFRQELQFEPGPISRFGWPNGGSTLEEVVVSYMALSRAEFVGMGVQAGRHVYLIEGRRAECAGFNGGRIVLAIDTETLFVLRHAVFAFETDELVQLQDVTAIQYDVELDESLLAPPAGMRVEDLSRGRSTQILMGDSWVGTDEGRSECY